MSALTLVLFLVAASVTAASPDSNCAHAEGTVLLNRVSAVALPPPSGYNRQAVRFGFDTPAVPPGPYHTPNCGCVTRGACSGEAGLYTRQVVHKSDLVCGLRFETCCFDGPWPGVADEFARAAACVPEERCVRPYGILPTDVRDFGAIAPCPGHGAVRCIIVDTAGLVEFKAALASIEAAQIRTQVDSAQVAQVQSSIQIPQRTEVVPAPVPVTNGGATYTSTYVQSQALPAPTSTYVQAPAQTSTLVQTPAVAYPRPVPIYTYTSAVQPPIAVAPVPVTNGGATYTSTYVQSPAPTSISVPIIPEPVPAEVISANAAAARVETSAIAPPVPVLPPVSGPLPVGGMGLFGGGLGFRKHFSLTKGYGFFG